MTSAAALDPAGGLTVTDVGFPDGRTGLVTGSRTSPGPVLFGSIDGGRSWDQAALPGTGGGSSSASVPCRLRTPTGVTWAAPFVAAGRLGVDTARQPEGARVAGASAPVSSTPVVACAPDAVWAAVPRGATAHLLVWQPRTGWADRGDVGFHLASLAVRSARTAIAASVAPAHLLEVQLGSQLVTTVLPLPTWVDTVGGGPAGD